MIVAEPPGKFALIKECLSGLFLQADDHELSQVIIANSLPDLAQVDALRREEHPNSNAIIIQAGELWKAAEHIVRRRVGPPQGDVILEPDDVPLSNDAKLLLRRAFYDCERISLEIFPDGEASISVLRVHGWLRQSIVGPLPLPFFVKIAGTRAIDREIRNYRLYAKHYIPFNLRPNIDDTRCVRTRSSAALVGDFVDDAVPLRQYLRLGQGVGVLFALFETSLRGFRLQPFAKGQTPRANFLDGFVKNRIRADELTVEVINRARTFGLSIAPADLQASICQAAENISCLVGPYHGDLHSGNVMVRGSDAILIDFSSSGDGPLTADPAALEVSLMFGTEGVDDADSFEGWRQFADEIYEGNVHTLHPPALSEGGADIFSWLRRSIRELRLILLGCNAPELEAKIVLATHLMRYARLGKYVMGNPNTAAFDRHAYALVVAERIVKGLAPISPGRNS
ncbi:MAG TPA: phosphotransferase [Terriglobales bacterium]|nr:phosphotransferase [Terriglobales bacterium]